MKNVFSLIFILLISYFGVNGQTDPTTTSIPNSVPSNCTCLTFVESCGGRVIPSLPGAMVTISCPEERSRVYEIIDGKVCLVGKPCPGATVCINGGNWEVCKVVGCTVYLSQSLPTNIRINGINLGVAPITPGETTALTHCGRRFHSGALNVLASATDILVCPGDPVELNIAGMSLLRDMCLSIIIKDLNNTVVASETYFSPSNILNISNLISNLTIGTYKIEMRIQCCNGPTECSFNTYKFAYINIQGQFAYGAYAISGFEPNTSSFIPATSPPSSLLTGGTTIGNIKINQLTLIGYNVQNSNNTSLNWKLNQVNCNTHNDPQQVSAGSLTPVNNFNIGPILITTATSCQCYRLDLTYDDGCGAGLITDFYYFKEGTNCPPNAFHDGGGTQNRSAGSNADESMCIVSPNPVTDHINIDMKGEWLDQNVDIHIFDSQGRTVKSIQLLGQPKLQIELDAVSGIYYYVIKGVGSELTGKFIKM